jgi:hypothetical protein
MLAVGDFWLYAMRSFLLPLVASLIPILSQHLFIIPLCWSLRTSKFSTHVGGCRCCGSGVGVLRLLKGWGAAMLLVVTAGVSRNRYCAATKRFYKFRNYRQFHNCSTLLMTCLILCRF